MKIVRNYRNHEALRSSFNALAEETFGLNFESWYQNGFWGDGYEPVSVLEDGQIVANVSVNKTDMVIGGQRKKFLQLGTVMTKPEYRNRGYIRSIMATLEPELRAADGVYLFANDSVLEFYPKFGFRKGTEYLYTKALDQREDGDMICVPMNGPADWTKLTEAVKQGEPLSACAMADNPGLFFFYVAGFMRENVFYSERLNAWAIAEIEDGSLLLHSVFTGEGVTLEDVIHAFGPEVKTVTLGFAPTETAGWNRAELHEEDCTFFVRGEALREFETVNLRIPSLSHA